MEEKTELSLDTTEVLFFVCGLNVTIVYDLLLFILIFFGIMIYFIVPTISSTSTIVYVFFLVIACASVGGMLLVGSICKCSRQQFKDPHLIFGLIFLFGLPFFVYAFNIITVAFIISLMLSPQSTASTLTVPIFLVSSLFNLRSFFISPFYDILAILLDHFPQMFAGATDPLSGNQVLTWKSFHVICDSLGFGLKTRFLSTLAIAGLLATFGLTIYGPLVLIVVEDDWTSSDELRAGLLLLSGFFPTLLKLATKHKVHDVSFIQTVKRAIIQSKHFDKADQQEVTDQQLVSSDEEDSERSRLRIRTIQDPKTYTSI